LGIFEIGSCELNFPRAGFETTILISASGVARIIGMSHRHLAVTLNNTMMEFYSFIWKNDTMWFEGKWMQLEDIMLSEVNQELKYTRYMFSLIYGR
jgi:hypothetical protein